MKLKYVAGLYLIKNVRQNLILASSKSVGYLYSQV